MHAMPAQLTQAIYPAKDSSLRQLLSEETSHYLSNLPKKSGGVATLMQWLRLVRVSLG